MLLAGIMLCLGLGACGSTGNDDGNDKPSTSTKRYEDTRELTPEQYTALNTVGTDDVGRYLREADGFRTGTRYVGIWYSLWEGQHTYMQTNVYDVEKLLSTPEGTAILNSPDHEQSKNGEFHFCGEPLYGYYNMLDPWVVTRHVELLTAAGIDYLSFDTTNAAVYEDVATLVIETLLKYQKQGFKVPKVMFYTNSFSGSTMKSIYNKFYQTEKYDDIWFAPNGKPFIGGITTDNRGASDQTMFGNYDDYFPEELRSRFEVIESQWPQGIIEHENSIPWMTWYYPQHIHPNYNAISVSVAQHGRDIYFSSKNGRSSRGYNHETATVEKEYWKGKNFENQWNTVFNYEKEGKEINHVMVCGWNEWMAIKNYDGAGFARFVDVYNEEFGRDCEMSKGKNGDNFYNQLAQNIRNWKTTEAKHYKYQKMMIDMTDDTLSQWSVVKAHYRDFAGDAMARDFRDAVDKGRYTDNSNRNDITDIKVVHNSNNLYIYVQTLNDITPYTAGDQKWMNVLINAGQSDKNFAGYNYVINRNPNADGTTSIERSTGGYNWESVATAEYKVYGNVILYSIPLSALGLDPDCCYIQFKVTDNVTKPEDIMDYYISGDCAPIGRLSYSYGY